MSTLSFYGVGFATEVVHTNLIELSAPSNYQDEAKIAKYIADAKANLDKSCTLTPLVAELREICVTDDEGQPKQWFTDADDRGLCVAKFIKFLQKHEEDLRDNRVRLACIRADRFVKTLMAQSAREKEWPLFSTMPEVLRWFVDPYATLVSEGRTSSLSPQAFSQYFGIKAAFTGFGVEVASQAAWIVATRLNLE